MRLTPDCLAVSSLSLIAVLTLGCRDSTPTAVAPPTGAIEITVSTASSVIDRDIDGYLLIIDGGPGKHLEVDTALTIRDLPMGKHLVRLDGLAPNCWVSGSNPRSVDVIRGARSPVSFEVACSAKSEPDPDGWDYWNYSG